MTFIGTDIGTNLATDLSDTGGSLPTPATIFTTAELCCWYRADNVTEAGTGISQATDLGTNANHVVQATDANRPSKTLGGSNGQPYMAFTSANQDRLRKTAGVTGFGTGAGYYMWMLGNWTGTGPTLSAFPAGGSIVTAALMLYRDGSGNLEFWMTLGGGVGTQAVVGGATGTGIVLVEGWFDTADSKLRCSVDRGVATASAAQANATMGATVAEVILGGSTVDASYQDGAIYDCGIAQVYTSAKQTSTRNYILSRYAE